MSGGDNTSQDPEYEGRPYHEKKFHKTHFGVLRNLKKSKRVQDDPDWEYVGVGKWRYRKPNRNAQAAQGRGGI